MHDAREYDAVVASGEQVTSGLLAIALQALGIQARSWQGWQIPIRTRDAHASARILDIDGAELMKRFRDRKEVAVIAGFRASCRHQPITTLGRGGSDTSAVAIAAAHRADRCDIYTDVDGVYTTDPRVVPKAAGSTGLHSRTCSSWRRWAQRCCRSARSNSAWCTTCGCSSARASTKRRTSIGIATRRAR